MDSSSKNIASLPVTSAEDDFVFKKLGETIYKFSEGKNQYIQAKRQLNFESIIPQLAGGDIVAIDDYHEGREAQGHRLYVINIDGYLHEVPFVEEAPNTIYLKNIYPSRKMMLKYWGRKRKSKRLKKRLKKETTLSGSLSVETFSVAVSISIQASLLAKN